jgi:hypothetical protein
MRAMKGIGGVPRFAALALSLAVVAGACGGDGPSAPRTPAAAVERAEASVDGQVAYTGESVLVAPSVVVRDARGHGVAGVSVTFAVTAGGGTLERTSATTNLSGVASAGRWTLGTTSGPNEVEARVDALPPVRFTAVALTASAPLGAFDITVRYVSTTTTRQRQAVEAAVLRWRTVIQDDVSSVPLSSPAGTCFSRQPALNETVDDLLLLIDFVTMDGVGKTLGEAGPCYIRTSSGLPILGYLKLDAADLANMEQSGTLDDVVLHELGHVLGIGTLWDNKELITGAGTSDPQFTGSAAIDAYRALGGVASGVPLENTGGTGTREGHWRESVFTTELMTGWVGQGSNPLSAMTIASLQDLGYGASTAAASAYTLSGTGGRSLAAIDLREREHITGPRFRIDGRGRVTPMTLFEIER